MSYINKKTRAFNEGPDTELNRRRSEGRIKTYPSATDVRSWCGIEEDRRQHILDLIRRDYDKCTPQTNHVPVGVVIQMLLANKKNEIQRLQKKIEELETKKDDEIIEPQDQDETHSVSKASSKSPHHKYSGDTNVSVPFPNLQEEELRTALEQCDELRARVKQLEDEKAELLKKLEDCECQNRKNKIRRPSCQRCQRDSQRHSQRDFSQRPVTAPSAGREAPSARLETIVEPRFATVTSDESSRQMMHQLDVLKSKGDSLKTKLEMERRRCNEIITKYTSTVTNMKLQIDIIKRANSRKKRPLRSTSFSESVGDIAICPCMLKSERNKSFGKESDLAEEFKHNCVLLR